MDQAINVNNNGLDRQGQDARDEGRQQHQQEQEEVEVDRDTQDQHYQNRQGQSYRCRLPPRDDSSSVQEIDIVFINNDTDTTSNEDSEQQQQQQQQQTGMVSSSNIDESFSMNLTNFSGQILIRKVPPSAQVSTSTSSSSSAESLAVTAETKATTAASDPNDGDSKSSAIETSAYQQHSISTTVESPSQDTRQQHQSSSSPNGDKSHRSNFSVSTSQWLDQVLEEGGQMGSMTLPDVVENGDKETGAGEHKHHSNPPTIPQPNKFMSPLDPVEHQRSVSVGSVGNTQFRQQSRRRSHLRRRTMTAFPQQSMRDVIGMEELEVAIVPPLMTAIDAVDDEEANPTATTTTRQNKNENISSSMTFSPSFDILQTVASPNLELGRLEAILDREGPEVIRNVDGKGRTALHILGSNSDLVSETDGQLVAKQCAILLMELYPEAITQKDDDGRMPFVLLIEKWVEWTHEQDEKKMARISASNHATSSCREDAKECVRSKLQKLLKPNQVFGSETKGHRNNSLIRRQLSGVNSNSQRSSLNSSSNRFPAVLIFEEVEWCFEMLSIAMDHLGGNPLDGSQQTRPTLSYRKQRKDRLVLAENVASIPQLLKTTMLLESNETRNNILESSVVRRALLCPQIIGPWLTSMLRYSKGAASDTSVEFLMTLSTLSVEDFIGTYRKPLLQDGVEFDEAKKSVYDAVWCLKDLTPSLLVLSDERWDRALATPLIWHCMNKEVTTSFAVSIATSDFQLIITTVIAVRDVAFGNVAEDGFSDIFPFLNIISVIFFTCLYSVIRRMCEFYALFRISSRVAWRYFLDPWHLLDFIAVVGAMIASANYAKLVDEGKDRLDIKAPVWIFAVMLGLLWLRVLSFLKAVNERLATFILALTRIFFDIRYFCAVLLVVVLLFGDVFHLLFTAEREDGGNACDADQLNPASEDFCTEEVLDSYLRVYAIIVGDFDLSDFRQTEPITIVWFLVTFIGLVVLLNTLIAIISVSYEKSHASSQLLFRRARCIFVAGNAAVEGFLRPRFFYAQSSSSTPRIDCITVSAAVVRWILILTFVVTVGISAVYIASRIVRAIDDSNILSLIALIFLSIVVLYVFWAAMVIFAGVAAHLCYGDDAEKSHFKRFFTSIDRVAVEFISSYMFGVDTDGDGGEPISLSVGRNDEVMEQLSHLQKAVEQLLQEQQQQQQIDATADHLSTDSGGGGLLLPPTSD